MKKMMSGMRTTGPLHIGHYFGTLKNWPRFLSEYQCFFGIMDYHGMTSAFKKYGEIEAWNRDMFAEFVAWGVDPERCTLFIQSQVPEHLELFMFFANITPMGWLERVPTWKDAEEELKASDSHNLGRFAYPVLQAADISVYLGEFVPVGQDQVAHLELNREMVRRFNHIYKAKLPEPKPVLTETPLVPGLDGRKMSKSYGNSLLLTEESKELAKKIRAMPTDPARVRREDPGEPTKCTVYTYHKLVSSKEDHSWVEQGCRSAGIGCGDCKGRLIENFEKMISGPRAAKKELLNNPDQLASMIKLGAEKARAEASKNLTMIKQTMVRAK